MDEKAEKILKAIQGQTRRMTDVDLTRATHLSLAVVRRRLRDLEEAGVVEEYWIPGGGTQLDRGPYYRVREEG